MNAGVAILAPVLRRPQNVRPLIATVHASTPEPYRLLFIADPDDLDEQAEVLAAGGELLIHGGSYAQKINAGIAHTTEPLVFLAADDLLFWPGWLQAATARLAGQVGVVGTNDLGNRRVLAGKHSTHSLVARWYIDQGQIDQRPGLLHEGYTHNFVDDELVAVAKSRGAYAHAAGAIVEHLHPNHGKAERDEVYELGMVEFRADRRRFLKRAPLWTR